MLNFIVMGEIPGTEFQLTFYGFLLVIFCIAFVSTIALLIHSMIKQLRKRAINYTLISI